MSTEDRRKEQKRAANKRRQEDPVRGPKLKEWFREHRMKKWREDPVYRENHRKQQRDAARKRAESNPEAWSEFTHGRHLRHTYSLSPADYRSMLEAQCGLCAICNQPERTTAKGKPRRMSVDHCHDTGRVRGLLCNSCNRGLGNLGDSVENLRRATKYLEGGDDLFWDAEPLRLVS